jgi:hypothetical protein
MMELNQPALALNEERMRETAMETMRAARASNGSLRHAAGLALVAVGQRLAGQNLVVRRPAAGAASSPKMQASGDCV